MKSTTLKPLALATLCLASAFALAYTSAPCDPPDPPRCTGSGNGAQCGSNGLIVISGAQSFAYYYCGGKTAGRCGGPGGAGTCSELLYKTGMAQHIQCISQLDGHVITDYGWCFVGAMSAPTSTGYDCGLSPCPDVPADQRLPPNIVGRVAPPCLTVGVYVITYCKDHDPGS